MDDLHLATASKAYDEFCGRPSLHRCHSWPPALSVSNFETVASIPQTLDAPHLLASPDLDQTVCSNAAAPTASFEGVASHSSSNLSLASEVSSVEVKKEGFRATVARRWLQTKHALHEKARLYREQHRAKHLSRALDGSLGDTFELVGDESAKANLLPKKAGNSKKGMTTEDTSKSDSDEGKRDRFATEAEDKVQESKVSERRTCDLNDAHLRAYGKKSGFKNETPPKNEMANGKSDKFVRSGKITNPPHELSSTLSQSVVGGDGDRGRRAVAGSYLRAFSSQGELVYNVHREQRKRKSRTLSGCRHSWRVPAEGIVTVFEETAPTKDTTGCDEDEATLMFA